jgi:acid phosphatase
MLNKIKVILMDKKYPIFILTGLVVIGGAFLIWKKIIQPSSSGTFFQTQALDTSRVVPYVAPKTPEKHVFIVLEENKNYSNVMGNAKDMPYLNSLANTYAYAGNYYANTHPSIGNYFMLTAGQIITNKDNYSKTIDVDNIVRQLAAAGKTWKEYSEDLPLVGYDGKNVGNYSEHHNPLSYFSDVRNNPSEAKNLVPFSQLAVDISNNTLPDYAFIVPNMLNDAHSCPPTGSCNELATADQWLKKNIDPLIKSPELSAPGGGLVIITFDEADQTDKANGGGHVSWVITGPDVKRGYVSHTFYQQENTLRFMAEEIGLKSFPGKAADVSGMQEFLKGD